MYYEHIEEAKFFLNKKQMVRLRPLLEDQNYCYDADDLCRFNGLFPDIGLYGGDTRISPNSGRSPFGTNLHRHRNADRFAGLRDLYGPGYHDHHNNTHIYAGYKNTWN